MATFNTTTYDDILDASHPAIVPSEIVLDGQTLELGQVVALQTSTGKIVAFDSAGADGADVFYGVILCDSAPSGADESGAVLVSGKVFEGNLIFANVADDGDTIRDDARLKGVYLTANQAS